MNIGVTKVKLSRNYLTMTRCAWYYVAKGSHSTRGKFNDRSSPNIVQGLIHFFVMSTLDDRTGYAELCTWLLIGQYS
jgi:hypothetical protein